MYTIYIHISLYIYHTYVQYTQYVKKENIAQGASKAETKSIHLLARYISFGQHLKIAADSAIFVAIVCVTSVLPKAERNTSKIPSRCYKE